MDKGEYVPDSVTNEMVESRLGEDDAANGFLLDGYPRTVAQVEALDGILEKLGVALDAVILLDVDSEAIVQRLLQRGKEQGRSDDNEETIRRRIDVYGEQTTPLIDIYDKRGLVKRVDGMKDIDAVTADILAALGA